MKNKSILLAAAAALFALPLTAVAEPLQTTPSTGFYAGVFGGYGWTDVDAAAGPAFDVDGGDYGIMAGYELGGLLQNNFNLGIQGALEISYAWSSADDTVGGVTTEKNHEWGINFRPGLTFISNAMAMDLKPYAILGYRRAEFESAGGDEGYDGFELGIGTELVAYGDYGVRLDYTHVFYEDKGGLDPDENDLRLGLTYHF